MKVLVNCGDVKMEIPCGNGKQHVRWLALAVATRMQREKYPHAFRVPQRVLRPESGTALRPREVICETLKDGEEVTVELRQGAHLPEDSFDEDWIHDAYGPGSNLMDCKIHWKVDSKIQQGFPKSVRGDYFVNPKWQGVYPQKEYGGHIEAQIEAIDATDYVEWIASFKAPPGTCNYKFVMEDGSESICKASPETLTRDGSLHHTEFFWDVPIAPDPNPEIDSRPSTASSRDGAQVDPRFEQDWENMRLRWVESFMKVRVKDVLTEFYAILIDLFDSYAFMGLDLSATQHTIGMDDWRHLIIGCALFAGQSQQAHDNPDSEQPRHHEGLAWQEACTWFEDAAGIKDGHGRPYLAQRLTRSHYLELLMRTAAYVMCENPDPRFVPDARNQMPLDEGLFRFITDVLIPVMDVYDDDPIRKDAVQHQNLVVIQQSRPSIRSMYSFMAQSWPYYQNEKVVVPATFKFVFEYAKERLEEAEKGGGATAAQTEEKKEGEGEAKVASGIDVLEVLGGEDKLTVAQIDSLLQAFDDTVAEIIKKHPEPPDHRALLFWEFFETLMQLCRALVDADPENTTQHEAIPAFVQTCLGVMALIDAGETQLPDPPMPEIMEEEAGEEGGP